MKIVSLQYNAGSGAFTGYVELDSRYYKFFSSPSSTDKLPVQFSVELRSYEHFVGIMGKFNPWIRFLADPLQVADLSFDELQRVSSDSPYIE